MEKKMHWTQTDAGKKKMSQIVKARWKSRRGKSRADLVVAAALKKGDKVSTTPHYERRDRIAMYLKVAKMAVRHGEQAEVMHALANELHRISVALTTAIGGLR